jgi:hypothetical protein
LEGSESDYLGVQIGIQADNGAQAEQPRRIDGFTTLKFSVA